MAGTEALAFFIIVPAIAWVIELLAIRGNYEATSRGLSSGGLSARPGRMYILVTYGLVSVGAGLFLWFLSKPLTDQLEAGTGAGSRSFQALLVWSAIAYGAAATVTAIARIVILRRGSSAC